jgi:hypothetical protein
MWLVGTTRAGHLTNPGAVSALVGPASAGHLPKGFGCASDPEPGKSGLILPTLGSVDLWSRQNNDALAPLSSESLQCAGRELNRSGCTCTGPP